ncbi:hypothetical protein [Bifidobacterium felsineum]|uniref:hypothetical protein n=1 Tax=Bifidobacterium felsineum TaxID=2045440 RepID=UPI001BDD5F6A|nr:hypothetical protein [Bifidobacterium felsineum]MBT1164961.1 hypothetical protein [Bifidobacterium felsineum]
MRIETGFTFHDKVTDDKTGELFDDDEERMKVDWSDPEDVGRTVNGLDARWRAEFADITSDLAARLLDGDTRSNLVMLAACMHAANAVFELVTPMLASELLDEDAAGTESWLPATLGCKTMGQYLDLMPDVARMLDARREARQSGKPVDVLLEASDVEMTVQPDGMSRGWRAKGDD